ncbi:PREDICTED: uncharacterized protein LOC104818328 [Tarenaya hassleriana]|uniref:uncharacterized protein LOC104818328 n=1 Tax=Tarenaya hassleriana TaxID=28532 RepID=UPI00053C8A74|nr:PREDICTED: uncharacterized protein LOC104818328 [Tarenaya hassleriana]
MENLGKQRVMFSEMGQEQSCSWLPKLVTTDNTALNWLRDQSYWYTKNDCYDDKNGQFAVAVAATAFAVRSVEEEEDEKRIVREELEGLNVKNKKVKRKDNKVMTKQEGRNIERTHTQEVKIGEENFTKKGYQHNGSSSTISKADSWECVRIKKIRKRYEKMKDTILAWENERKLAARLKMEKSKSELERRKEINNRRYRSKLSRIEMIARGAKQQLEEKRKSEEARVKEKANTMRRTGKVPMDYFCFRCY